MSAEIALVPDENMTALDTLDNEAREVAITGMLDQARAWLAHSVEATEPTRVQNFRAYIATVAESTKQLRLSKEIQADATEMIRRAERGVTLAIRKGQEDGTVASGRGVNGSSPAAVSRGDNTTSTLPTAKDIAPDFYNNGNEIAHLGDHFTDDEFEEALGRAKEEGNLSRANVLRKGAEIKSGAERQTEKWDRVATLAAEGHTRHQVAEIVGMTHRGVTDGARSRGIAFPADSLGKRRRLDSSRVMSGVTSSVAAAAFSIQQIDLLDLDEEEAQEWADSLSESITTLRRAVRQIRESFRE